MKTTLVYSLALALVATLATTGCKHTTRHDYAVAARANAAAGG